MVAVSDQSGAFNGNGDEKLRVGDLITFGRYTLIVCLVTELCLVHIVGNMLFMIYAGKYDVK